LAILGSPVLDGSFQFFRRPVKDADVIVRGVDGQRLSTLGVLLLGCFTTATRYGRRELLQVLHGDIGIEGGSHTFNSEDVDSSTFSAVFAKLSATFNVCMRLS
jgi:hypothetical protein